MSEISEMAELLDSDPSGGGSADPETLAPAQLRMSVEEAVSWAESVDLETISAFTDLQKREMIIVFAYAMRSGVKHYTLPIWTLPYVRSNTVKKMSAAGFIESASEALSRCPEDAAWLEEVALKPPTRALSPIGEQVAAALALSEDRTGFRKQWADGKRARAAVLAAREREREVRASQAARHAAIREICAANPTAAAALQKAQSDHALHVQYDYEPPVVLGYDQLAAILGGELPKLIRRR